MFGSQRVPKDAVGNHPAVREIHIGAELHCHHFIIHLNNNALDPSTNALAAFFVIAKHLYRVTHFKSMFKAGSLHESKLAHT